MVIKRDSLRAERDFYSPMTGNTGTEIRYADAPTKTKSTYGSKVKDRLSEIGQNTRRSAPIIKAIKTAMKKTDDPFTQIAEQKSYAPQEENDIGAQIQGLAGQAADAVSQAQDAIGEGVTQARQEFEGYKKSQSKKQAERRAERLADLKAARDARQNIRTDFQNRVRGVSDEVSGVRKEVKTQGDRFKSFSAAQLKRDIQQDIATRKTAQDQKTYEKNRARQRELRKQALDKRISGVESGISGVRSEVKAYEKTRARQRELRKQALDKRISGVEAKQAATAKKTKDYRSIQEKQMALRRQALDKRIGSVETSVIKTRQDQKAYEKRRAEQRALRQESVDRNLSKVRGEISKVDTKVDTKVGEVKKMYGQGGLALGTTTQRQGGTVKGGVKVEKKDSPAVNASTFRQKNVRGGGVPGKSGKDESARPKQVANLPSNYKATEAKAFAEAKAYKERQARVKAAKVKATKVKSERARAQAAAAKAKSEGKTKAQQAAAARKAAGPNRTMSAGQQTRAQAGPSARTAAGNRARVKANARKRAQAAAKKRKAAKKAAPKKKAPRKTRTRTARRRGRRRGRRRCDIMLKFDISLLTNNNLRHDDLAEVAYFVRALREVEP